MKKVEKKSRKGGETYNQIKSKEMEDESLIRFNSRKNAS
jgi:hypothetical protein